MSKVSDELDAMLKSLSDRPEPEPAEEEPAVEPASEEPTEEPVEEPSEEEEEVVEEEEPEPEETPSEEEPEEEEVEEPEEDKDAVIANLRAQLAERKTTPEPEEEPEPEPQKQEPVKLEDIDFVGDTDVDELLADKEGLNKLLNAVFSRGVEVARTTTSESVLREIPMIVKRNVELVGTLKKASDDFYAENPDLKPFRKVVSVVFEDVQSENPDKGFEDVMKMVAPEVRKRLDLKKKAVRPNKEDKPPRLPSKKASPGDSSDKPDLSGIEDELDAMNKVVTRR